MGFWNKKINKKNITKLSNEIGVEEEKIKELIKGEREISGETMDKVLNVLNEDKIQNAIEKQEIMKWYYETDLSELRKSFGYSQQKELANELKCHPSSICNLENHKDKVKQISPLIEQLYYFYKNDFNKKLNKKSHIEQDKKTIEKTNEFKKHNIDKKTIYYWYATNNLKKLREDRGILTQKELAKITKLPQSTVSDFENKRFKTCNSTITTLYNFYNNLNNSITNVSPISVDEVSEVIDNDGSKENNVLNIEIQDKNKDFTLFLEQEENKEKRNKNNIQQILLNSLARLDDEEYMKDNAKVEIPRSNAISKTAQTIVNMAKTNLSIIETARKTNSTLEKIRQEVGLDNEK